MDDDNTQLKALLKFLKVVEDLKATYRTGWLRVFKDSKQKAYFNPESVASHSWGVALLVALFVSPRDLHCFALVRLLIFEGSSGLGQR